MAAYSSSKFAVRGITQIAGMCGFCHRLMGCMHCLWISVHSSRVGATQHHRERILVRIRGNSASYVFASCQLPENTHSSRVVAHPDDDKLGGHGAFLKQVLVFSFLRSLLYFLTDCCPWHSSSSLIRRLVSNFPLQPL